MLYKPSYGKFKDNCVFWHNGCFYLFSMFTKTENDYRNIWLAKSADGVHWEDVGAIIEDSPFYIWAMSVYEVDGIFYLNHGSFGEEGEQNLLKFWKSSDLVHWEYMGRDYDVKGKRGRLDCMNVIKSGDTYYGYATGPDGFLKSDDGIHWDFCDTKIDFYPAPAVKMPIEEGVFEIGGCYEIEGKTYLLGGWFNYMGRKGYSVYTLRADKPDGTFSPDMAAYRLCGNSERWVYMWARFCKTDKDLLVNAYMQEGYSYECGDTWMPPLKRAVVDKDGHLQLAYWNNNDLLMGEELDLSQCKIQKITFSDNIKESFELYDATTGISVFAREELTISHTEKEPEMAVVDLDIESDKGAIICGRFLSEVIDKRLSAPSFGIILTEDEKTATEIRLHGFGLTEIGESTWETDYCFKVEDTIDAICAAPAGFDPEKEHNFKLIIRGCMVEFYLDDFHVQTFNTARHHNKTGKNIKKIGFVSLSGKAVVKDLKICRMK